MFETLAYYTTGFYRDFVAYTTGELQKLGMHFASLFPVIYVGKHPGCTQAELTNALGMEWGYSQRNITRLVEGGFLLREKKGRAYCLELSDKGKEAFRLSHQVFFDWDREQLSALTEEEQNQLFTLLAKVKQKEANQDSCMKP